MYSKLSQPFPERICQAVRSYLPRIYSNKMLNILLEILLEICRKYLEIFFVANIIITQFILIQFS